MNVKSERPGPHPDVISSSVFIRVFKRVPYLVKSDAVGTEILRNREKIVMILMTWEVTDVLRSV